MDKLPWDPKSHFDLEARPRSLRAAELVGLPFDWRPAEWFGSMLRVYREDGGTIIADPESLEIRGALTSQSYP